MFDLAQTVWPRFGGDRANRSFLSIPGPHTIPSWQKILLPTCEVTLSHMKKTTSGVIVMPDETLRVLHGGLLIAVTLDGTILWQVDLRSLISEDEHWISSLPTALQTGETLLLLPNELLLVDGFGGVRRQDYQITSDDGEASATGSICPDDSGFSPNLTYNGLLILSAVTGEVYLFKKNRWQEIGIFGYDIVTPAVYPDNSLAIAGFAGKGFCRVSLDGEIHWRTQLKEADLLPTLNQEHIAAVGSLNERYSAFFRPDGQQIGEYHHAATFAVHPDGGWVALSKHRLARLTLEGREVWGREMYPGDSLSWVEQPLVDKDGFIFVRQQEGFLCCDAQGRVVFEVKLSHPSQGLMSIVAPRVVAYTLENELFIGYN
jgi:hypothetical protein